MQFKFESEQPHQMDAVESIVELFRGFPRECGRLFDSELTPILDEELLYRNYCRILRTRNNIRAAENQPPLPINPVLRCDEGPALRVRGLPDQELRYPVFTVDMETGAGKTYTYFRTIHELRARCGFRKFIIVTPGTAIFEGTAAAFRQMRGHFSALYRGEQANLIEYDSRQLNRLSHFASSQCIEILVMTIDSFNRSTNLIFKDGERGQEGRRPIQYIQSVRPVLILDESQNYRSDISRQALRRLNPLFAINYSATPADPYNLVYRLSPVDAFRQNLVKKIRVFGVTQQHNVHDAPLSLELESISSGRGLPQAKVKAAVIENGTASVRPLRLRQGDDLSVKTRNPEFAGFVVEEINKAANTVVFTNQSILTDSRSITLSKKEIFRVQIEETIRCHFERQKELRARGIKVLSLFFIDRVANYTGAASGGGASEPFIKILFENAFNKLKAADPYFKNIEAAEVHKGYFAQKKGDAGFLDSFETANMPAEERKKILEAEKNAFRLIMRDKEKLLSFSEKTAFLFAHSALREGWDNPNVFCICTLNSSRSDSRKRQEIGRGLRLARNEAGDQIKDESVNILTVVANESYEEYVSALQSEYAESGDAAPPTPAKTRRCRARRKDAVFTSPAFIAFWKRLSRPAEYSIIMDTDALIKECAAALNAAVFPSPRITVSAGAFVLSNYAISLLETKLGCAKIQITVTDTSGRRETFMSYFPVGYDFYRWTKDKNLRGYKIVQIEEKGERSVVHFGNDVSVRKGELRHFSGRSLPAYGKVNVHETQSASPVLNLIERAAKETGLTRSTVLAVFKNLHPGQKQNIFVNPEGFAEVFIRVLKDAAADQIAENIVYRPLEMDEAAAARSMEEFFPREKDFPQQELIPGSAHSLYDKVQIDSDVEQRFVQNRLQQEDRRGNVLCYFKFPAGFKIRIPAIIFNYNPDWGIVLRTEDGKGCLELVRETKGSMNLSKLQYPHERRKILCARRHFSAIGVNYREVSDAADDWAQPFADSGKKPAH
ncbi:MAG: DEAD/DEAH box helicase family protein [Treponema sp.]|jgi:type III restriction enzyme|nr:DEAD/DEAH box helicase family protein [Treponema sp.]